MHRDRHEKERIRPADTIYFIDLIVAWVDDLQDRNSVCTSFHQATIHKYYKVLNRSRERHFGEQQSLSMG